MKRVAITGAKGRIGRVLVNGLRPHELTPIDLPEIDVRDYKKLVQAFSSHDTVIHLAYNPEPGSAGSCDINVDNLLMTCNVYGAAEEAGVPRVIMASSVHADTYWDWKGPGLMIPFQNPVPDSSYGAYKVFLESLGRYYAGRGMEVVCIRYGGLNVNDTPDVPEEKGFSKIWLSHRDCVELAKACIESPKIPDNFQIIYGVSDNAGRVHNFSNPLGWTPKDGAENISG